MLRPRPVRRSSPAAPTASFLLRTFAAERHPLRAGASVILYVCGTEAY